MDALLIKDPRSLLFKAWARGDGQHAPCGEGFKLLVVGRGSRRCVISVDPQAPYHLEGLGDLLEIAETRKRTTLSLERPGASRPGYDNPDPWYDGRNPLHGYTIVDSPRAGTVLSWEEINEILRQFSRQQRAK